MQFAVNTRQKTNKICNNCSTKDLVVKAADIFKAKPYKRTQTL